MTARASELQCLSLQLALDQHLLPLLALYRQNINYKNQLVYINDQQHIGHSVTIVTHFIYCSSSGDKFSLLVPLPKASAITKVKIKQ